MQWVFIAFIGLMTGHLINRFADFLPSYWHWHHATYKVQTYSSLLDLKLSSTVHFFSFRHRFVEWSISCLFTLILSLHGISIQNILLLIVISQLMLIALIDIDHYLIADVLLIVLLLILLLFNHYSLFTLSCFAILLHLLAGFFILWLPAKLFFMIRHYHGLGGGDPKLMAVLSIGFPLDDLPYTLLIASIAVIIFSFITHHMTLQTKIPFAPFLCFATGVVLIFNHFMIEFYFPF